MRMIFCTVVMVFLLSGCVPKIVSPQTKEYILETKKVANTKRVATAENVIKLNRTTSKELYDSNDMFYKNLTEFDKFAYNRWAASPANMLNSALESAIENSGVFKSVLNHSSDANKDFVIESELGEFYQLFSEGKSYAIVSIKLNLISSKKSKVVASKRFSYKKECKSNNPAGGVATFELILADLVSDVSSWLVQTHK